jgi:hypothetical protein
VREQFRLRGGTLVWKPDADALFVEFLALQGGRNMGGNGAERDEWVRQRIIACVG